MFHRWHTPQTERWLRAKLKMTCRQSEGNPTPSPVPPREDIARDGEADELPCIADKQYQNILLTRTGTVNQRIVNKQNETVQRGKVRMVRENGSRPPAMGIPALSSPSLFMGDFSFVEGMNAQNGAPLDMFPEFRDWANKLQIRRQTLQAAAAAASSSSGYQVIGADACSSEIKIENVTQWRQAPPVPALGTIAAGVGYGWS